MGVVHKDCDDYLIKPGAFEGFVNKMNEKMEGES
jgi:hypothetical protein